MKLTKIILLGMFILIPILLIVVRKNMTTDKSRDTTINAEQNIANNMQNKMSFATKGESWSIKEIESDKTKKLFYESKEPFRSSAWYKSIAINSCENTFLYPTPYILKITPSTLEIGTQQVSTSENTITTTKAPSVILEFQNKLTDCSIIKVGQLDVEIKLASADGSFMILKIVKGLAYFEVQNSGTKFNINNISELEKTASRDLIISTNDKFKYFIKALEKKETDNINANEDLKKVLINNFVIGMIPETHQADEYIAMVPSSISIPQIDFSKSDLGYSQKISFTQEEIFILLPHHQAQIEEPFVNAEVFQNATLNGNLKFAHTKQIKIFFKNKITDPYKRDEITQKQKSQLKELLISDINKHKEQIHSAEGVYWKGKTLAKFSNLMNLAYIIGDTNSFEKIKAELETELEDLFNYTGEADSKFFIYDKNLKTLLSNKPEYGHEDLNDHHFHYGYYLYTLGVLAHYDPTIINKYKTIAGYMSDDAANFDKKNTNFPYLRHFDLYDARSNASGLIYMYDGNNQESTSEAANFWYGGYLWYSEVAKQDNSYNNRQNLFAAGYSMETDTIYYYYFNGNPIYDIFPDSYKHQIASIVFEGKKDFATWFSADPNAIHGIQVIPVTKGSMYLKSPFYKVNFESQKNESKNNLNSWKDMTAMYLIINNDQTGTQLLNETETFDSGNSKAWSKYMEIYFSQN